MFNAGFKPAQIALLAIMLGFCETSRAQTSWAAASSGNWNTAGSWTPAIVPVETTNAFITNSGTFTVTYNSPMAATSIGSLTLGLAGASTSIPTLTITATGFNVSGSTTTTGTSAEVVNVNSGGVMTNGTLNMGDYNGVVNVSGIMTNGATQVGNAGTDGNGALKINSGAVASLGTLTVGRNNESASYGLQISGGTVSASSIAVGSRNSYATMAVGGGTVTNAGSLQLGTGSATAGREVRYYQTGGTVGCAGTVDMAVTASFTTWFSVLNSSSTFYAAGIRIFPNAVSSVVARFTNSGSIYLGATGFNVLNSGTYTVALNDQSLLGATADWSGNVNMVTGSGTVTFKAADAAGTAHNITLTSVISGAANLTKTGGGTLALYGANTYSGATTVSAGSLVLENAGALPKGTALTLGGSGSAGALDLAGFNAQVSGLAVGSGATAANQIITNSSVSSTSTLTFSNSSANGTFGGVVAGGVSPIALAILGGGLTLSAQNSYGGNLFVSSGKLALSGAGSTFTGAAIVLSNSAAALDISGMGGITLGAGQSLSGYGVVTGSVTAANCPISPGAVGTAGTLSFSNNLTLNGGVTNHFDLALNPVSAGNDLIVVGGALNVSGTNTIELAPLGASLSAGTYKLITFGSLGSGGAANFQVTGTPGASLQSAISVTNTEVDLIVSATGGTQRTWVGDGSANAWDYTTTNWLNAGTLALFNDGNFVTFDDTGSVNPPVNLTATLQPAAVLVNAAANYTFSGIGQISGAGTLTKTNSGVLTILTTNNYSGDTIISQGILQLGNGTTSGSLGTNVIDNSGALVLDLPGNNTFSNLVSGTGSLVQSGSGTLTLTASNSYSGGTTISNGTLQLNTGAWFGSGNVMNNGSLVINSSANLAVGTIISGSGSVTLASNGMVTLTGNNTYSGGTMVNKGTLLVNNSSGSGTGSGPLMVASGGTLSGDGVIGGAVTINSGGIYAPGNPVGTLTVSNNFTAAGGAILNYTLGTSSGLTIVSSNLNLSGTLNITAGGGFTSGTFTLFTYGGALTLGSLVLNLPANSSAALNTNTPGQVNLVVAALQSNIPAFPGALGFGANATGARFSGSVYHVTNLGDSGAGSFRDAVSQANRFIVFDVGGTITLASAVSCSSSLTIAGQTAPGDGIAIIGHEVSFSAKQNEIVRYLRIRPGSLSSSGEDAINIGDGTNMIFDHCSFEFAGYNNIDAHGNVGSDAVTVQNSIIGDPMSNGTSAKQGFGAHTEHLGGKMAWYYNLWVSEHNRQPLAKIDTIFVNNTEYNFQSGYTVADTSGNFRHDIINNYFITGPTDPSGGNAFYQMNANQTIYSTGNLIDNNNDGSLNGGSISPGGGGTVLTAPWSTLSTNTTVYSTACAYHYDVSLAGAVPYDQLDSLIISQIKTLGNGSAGTGAGTAGPGGGLYYDQTSTGLGNNGYGILNGGTAPLDTDQDGMPDYWEEAMGSNTNVADSLTPGVGGYTKLENYLNWLAALHAVTGTNAVVNVDLTQYTGGFTNVSPVYSVFAPTNGTVMLPAGHMAQFTPAPNFSGLASFNFSVLAGDGMTVTSTVVVCVSPLLATPPPPSLTWHGDGLADNWDNTTTNWLNGTNPVAFVSGDPVTFDDTGSNNPAINLVGLLMPGLVKVSANQNYTFAGNGSLGGSMSLAKSGAGILTLDGTNSYTGGTVVSNGTLQVNNTSGSATGSNQVFVATGATLSGSGIIGGQTALDDGATLAPGNGIGTLTISNELDLSDQTVLLFGLGTAGDKVVVSGNLTLGGQLNITNTGGFGTGTYTLFNYGGALTMGNLTVASAPPGFGYSVSTNTPGLINLVVTRPQFKAVNVGANGLVMSGSGGAVGGNYYVLVSTNLALPLNLWTPIATNQFDSNGNFDFTNTPGTNTPQDFYLLQLQ